MFGENAAMEELYQQLLAEVSANAMAYMLAFVGYILLGLGMYTIAKRRGITNPALAWVPLGQSWMLGCISDQYQYVTMGREKNKRKLLLMLEIGYCLLIVVVCVLLMSVLWNSSVDASGGQTVTEPMLQSRVSAVSIQLMATLLLSLAMLGFAIAYAVMKYVALYDLFRSCDPARATMFTILSVLLGAFVTGIAVVNCQNKDFGMPPRRDQAALEQPIYQLPPQNWHPPQPPKEPWEE